MIVKFLILGVHVYRRAGSGFQLLGAADMIDVSVSDNDGFHA